MSSTIVFPVRNLSYGDKNINHGVSDRLCTNEKESNVC